jgi:ubiquinone/menaquinone biosynthesis C-methylase UbiE
MRRLGRSDPRLETNAAGTRWEQFAQSRPMYYIDPTLGRDVAPQEFIEGGRAVVERALGWAGEIGGNDRALEIGCGVGRTTRHLAGHFIRVDGVDVSPTMVRLARERGLPENVALHVLSGQDLEAFSDGSFNFVFSHLVFQHVMADATIERYLNEIARVLMPGGIAVIQFDTRPASLPAALVHRLPDVLLPRVRRRGIRRHRRPASQIREFGRAAGLTLTAERDPDTADHWFRWHLSAMATNGKPHSPAA